jgi:hypothetical protein
MLAKQPTKYSVISRVVNAREKKLFAPPRYMSLTLSGAERVSDAENETPLSLVNSTSTLVFITLRERSYHLSVRSAKSVDVLVMLLEFSERSVTS